MAPLPKSDAGFLFDLVHRNRLLAERGLKAPMARKTGTTIVGVLFKDGIVLGADTRATNGPIVADKNCAKIHYIAPNIYCCGAGTAADTEFTTDHIASQLELHRLTTGRQTRVVTALTMLKQLLYRYHGHVGAALILGGFDINGPHLHTVHPHGSTDTLPFVTMGSGSLAAMSIFESFWKPNMTREEGIELVKEAICAGIFNDLGSGSNVDINVITKNKVEILRNYLKPNERATRKGDYSIAKGTTAVITESTKMFVLEERDPYAMDISA